MTTRRLLAFEPFDTLWFRDGRPFEQFDEGLAEARSVFPPSPSTIAGALTLAMARAQAGSAHDPAGDDWSEYAPLDPAGQRFSIASLVQAAQAAEGTGPQVRFTGPFLVQRNTSGPQAVSRASFFVPWPATLLLAKNGDLKHPNSYRNLLPQGLGKGVMTDLGAEVRQLVAPVRLSKAVTRTTADTSEILKGFDHAPGAWLGWEDFIAYATNMFSFGNGSGVPLNRLLRFEAAKSEIRIGIQLDGEKRAATPGQLYAGSHFRTSTLGEDGIAWSVSIALQVEFDGKELPADLAVTPVALGGKGRASAIVGVDAAFGHPPTTKAPSLRVESNDLLLRLIAVTPVPIDPEKPFGLPVAQSAPEESPFASLSVEAAVTYRPVSIGLWRGVRRSKSRDVDGRPRILCVFPAGSTWFVRLPLRKGAKRDRFSDELWRAAFRARLAPPSLAAMGFGAFVVGNWPDRPG